MYPIHFFDRAVRLWPDHIAVEHGDRTQSYKALHDRVQALAVGLQTLDPEFGSRVGICCYNSIDHLVSWLAVLAAGKVWVPLQPMNAKTELVRAIEFTQASIVIAQPDTVGKLDGADTRFLICDPEGGPDTTTQLRKDHDGQTPAIADMPLSATQAIKFTGGTTGLPKGVMQPYRAWNTNIAIQVSAWSLGVGQRYLAAAPITHGTSTYILPTLATGGTLVLLDRPRPEETLQFLQNAGITTTFVPPTVLYMLMELDAVGASDYAHLKNLIYGAGPMRPDAIERAQKIFGPCLASTYGQTEAPQIATMISAQELLDPAKRASVGRETFLSQVEIMDTQGKILPAGETGEIVIRGDLLMTGYWNQPDVTARTLVDGWLHTGDLGLKDEDGYVFIRGRAKEMIITGGFNVYPADVETVMGEHPEIIDCAVYGVPDEKWGEAVHAAVQVRDAKAASAEDIIAFIRERLGPVQTPKSIRFLEALPRNAIGKLQKMQLAEEHLAQNAETLKEG
ncbi:AMP-dependent synthetase and ligase [Roseobacter sp. AzwK-3b]|uniref:class I adenylate-forming enzyme family protein n=1 Tax=Roseobacter sp. AzwK-3b TaxID=351016 RepID=UPI000156A199|nr:AMP-binding protein [Roseobacter sp. AzwK-3b]EDM69880.1 AMP-dependent synthetase and ligase [Roseobacter sp. AzwK-3b]